MIRRFDIIVVGAGHAGERPLSPLHAWMFDALLTGTSYNLPMSCNRRLAASRRGTGEGDDALR